MKSLKIIKLAKEYQPCGHDSLENRCIKKILDFGLDLTVYDLIDALYCNRVLLL